MKAIASSLTLSRKARRICVPALACALTAVFNVADAAVARANTATPAAESSGFLSSEITAYTHPRRSFTDGVWNSPNRICWACNNGGPASAAATAYMLGGSSQPELLREAQETIEIAIGRRQHANGSFSGPAGDTQSPEAATMFFGVEMGNTYLQLQSVLGSARRARWHKSLSRAASYLIHSGNVTWYTNGNINLGNIELLYLAWRATGDSTFQKAYERAWSFVLSPPRDRWPGDGLIIRRHPTRADGSDGEGYLAENGAGGSGFDAEYAELQLDVASRLYLISGDHRALRLANMLLNTLLPRVDSNWQLNTSHGTRHTDPNRRVPFMTSALAVLGLRGGRTSLIHSIVPQLKAIEAAYAQPWNFYGEVYRRALGNDIAVIALASSGSEATALGARARADAGGAPRSSRHWPGHRYGVEQVSKQLRARPR